MAALDPGGGSFERDHVTPHAQAAPVQRLFAITACSLDLRRAHAEESVGLVNHDPPDLRELVLGDQAPGQLVLLRDLRRIPL